MMNIFGQTAAPDEKGMELFKTLAESVLKLEKK
jgi:hypothetical protein